MPEAPLRVPAVFIPGGVPRYTYVPRAELPIETRLSEWKRGAHTTMFSISGPTKTGKTVLLKRFFPDAIWLSGGTISTVDDFWAAIADALELYTDHELQVARDTSSSVSGGVDANSVIVKVNVGGALEDSHSKTIGRGRQRTPQMVGREALRERLPTVVLDDFHYIPSDVQLKIVRALKDLIFEGLPVVVAAVPHRAYDVVRVENEMTGRVDSLSVGLWSETDLEEIAIQGFSALNFEDPGGVLASRLAQESFASPHLMQAFCLALSQKNGYDEASAVPVELVAPQWVEFFTERATLTSKTAFDMLKQGPRQRADRIIRTLKTGTTTDIYGAVLAAVESTGPRTQLTYEEVRAALRNVMESDPPQRHEVTRVLDEMTRTARERIAGEPVLEYDDQLSTLYIADPFFAFYLRWADHDLKSESRK